MIPITIFSKTIITKNKFLNKILKVFSINNNINCNKKDNKFQKKDKLKPKTIIQETTVFLIAVLIQFKH